MKRYISGESLKTSVFRDLPLKNARFTAQRARNCKGTSKNNRFLEVPSGLVFLCIFFTACNQEPLFWDIAHEYPPIKPIIEGAPSRIVSATYPSLSKLDPVLYVSNGEIWECDTNTDAVWRKMSPQPGGKVKTLAAVEGYLFSLDWAGNIRKWNGTAWSNPLAGITGTPEQIFGAENYLFAGALTGTPASNEGYCIMAMEATGSAITLIKKSTGLLSGAVYGGSNYFLGSQGDGIYITDTPAGSLSTPISGTSGLSIIGLVKHGDYIVAVTTGRQIIYSGSGSANFTSYVSPGVDFSGAMASWEDRNGHRLLLLGLLNKSGSFGYGYRELVWKKGGNFTDDKRLYVPGEAEISSVKLGGQYNSAIGNYGVTSLYVLPFDILAGSDEQPIVYASTVKNGLWSYRSRGGTEQWNGEDNSR
ncbi:MAG: hypothetical protein LBB72_05675 [Spirochaetaceae bacterium]|jgi:hypothetical protein|nr:hypothetical protein [Spirochaetaceae bacterium]